MNGFLYHRRSAKRRRCLGREEEEVVDEDEVWEERREERVEEEVEEEEEDEEEDAGAEAITKEKRAQRMRQQRRVLNAISEMTPNSRSAELPFCWVGISSKEAPDTKRGRSNSGSHSFDRQITRLSITREMFRGSWARVREFRVKSSSI